MVVDRSHQHNTEPEANHSLVNDKSHDEIAKIAISGQQLSVPTPKPGILTEPSEITDGGEMYAKERFGTDDVSDTSIDPQQTLQERIFAELCRVDVLQKGFLPRGRLERLINKDVVIEWMTKALAKTYSPVAIQTYASKICARLDKSTTEADEGSGTNVKSYRKIFVILTLIEMEDKICKFVDDGVSDDDLPLQSVGQPGKPGLICLRRKGDPNTPLTCFDGWRPMRIINFEDWQWVVLAPFFARGTRKNVGHYVLKDKAIMPFTWDSRRQANGEEFMGGFGQVFHVCIHSDHHNFGSPEVCLTPLAEYCHRFTHRIKLFRQGFAIKSLNSTDKADFKKEVEMLNKFSDEAHPHLISLLATYEQRNKFYLIFKWADADLLRFWRHIEPNPQVDYETIIWLANQCEGLANGLLKLHQYVSTYEQTDQAANTNLAVPQQHPPERTRERRFGRHGDIKPANILWFRDPQDSEDKGTLRISDFGLAEFNSRHSRSNRPNSHIAFSVSYRPPECDLKGAGISRSYDIWSLGCLYLEFIAWQLGGWDLVRHFARQRCISDTGSIGSIVAELQEDTFFEILPGPDGKPIAQVKRAVTAVSIHIPRRYLGVIQQLSF